MVSKPLVSAICPTNGRPRFLKHAVELLKAQTWKDVEMIVLDDSPAALRANLSKEPLVRHVILDEPTTIGAKHNLGNEMAQGDAVVYWDDDDWYGPRRIVSQLGPIVAGHADVTGFTRDLVLVAGAAPKFFRIKPLRYSSHLWVGNGATNLRVPIHDGSAMFSRRVIDDRRAQHPDQTMNEKVEYLNRVAELGYRHAVIPNRDLLVYVRHGANTWKYREGLVHVQAQRPLWFPEREVEFYRGGAA